MERSLNLLSAQGQYRDEVDEDSNQRYAEAYWTIQPVFEPKIRKTVDDIK